jgi:TetR/AcrR family transcriptional repressor of mexJK operon
MRRNIKFKKESPKRGRPVDITKRDDILRVAGELFMQNGFAQTSMDQIAQKAGMSKLTLYTRFKDKNTLFTAVIQNKCQQHIPDSLFDVFDHRPLSEAMNIFGMGLFSLVMSDDAINMYRMMTSEARHNPELTQMFYDTGPKRVKALLAEKLRQHGVKNYEIKKDYYTSLLTGSDLHMRALLNIGKKPRPSELKQHVEQATEFFIHGLKF